MWLRGDFGKGKLEEEEEEERSFWLGAKVVLLLLALTLGSFLLAPHAFPSAGLGTAWLTGGLGKLVFLWVAYKLFPLV